MFVQEAILPWGVNDKINLWGWGLKPLLYIYLKIRLSTVNVIFFLQNFYKFVYPLKKKCVESLFGWKILAYIKSVDEKPRPEYRDLGQ